MTDVERRFCSCCCWADMAAILISMVAGPLSHTSLAIGRGCQRHYPFAGGYRLRHLFLAQAEIESITEGKAAVEKGRFEQFLQEAYLLLGGISRVLASCFQSESFCPECGFLLPGIALRPLVEEFGLKKSGLLYRSWNRVFLICFVEGLCSQRGCMEFLEGR